MFAEPLIKPEDIETITTDVQDSQVQVKAERIEEESEADRPVDEGRTEPEKEKWEEVEVTLKVEKEEETQEDYEKGGKEKNDDPKPSTVTRR